MHGVTGRLSNTVTIPVTPPSRTVLLLLVLMTGLAPVSLYMLVPTLPELATVFGRDISVAQMTVSLYMVGLAVSQIVMGPLSDRYGRRPILLGGISLMVVASIGCIFAQSLPQLIAARLLQGCAGAMMGPVGRLVLLRTTPKNELVGAMSVVTMPALLGPVVGPVLGGAIVTFVSWRWIFFLNLPIAALGVVMGTLAAILPARRAAGLDPLQALTYE